MSFAVQTTLSITGDSTMFERLSNNLRHGQALMENIGVLAMTSGQRRLQETIALREGISTGRLFNSLFPGRTDNVFDVTNLSVEVGSNVRYAAQRQFGGIIRPKTARALAIPLTDQLKRDGIGPREIQGLIFRPAKSGAKANVIGVLIDPGKDPVGRQRKRRSVSGFGIGPLFVLVTQVEQPARPFLFWDESDVRTIMDDLIPQWLDEVG